MRIAILRVGAVDENILNEIQSGLSEIYPESDCLILDEIMSIPADVFSKARQQFHSTRILTEIDKYAKQTSVDRLLGITEVDLYVPRLNFVFGEATCPGKTAVISLFRLKREFYGHSANRKVFIDRCVKEAVHEIGHTLGLKHCHNPRCVMFFSNSISDTDRKGRNFCEKCYPKAVRFWGR